MSGLQVPHSFPNGVRKFYKMHVRNLLTHKLVVVLECVFLFPLDYWF